jgi:hypothetical protein
LPRPIIAKSKSSASVVLKVTAGGVVFVLFAAVAGIDAFGSSGLVSEFKPWTAV